MTASNQHSDPVMILRQYGWGRTPLDLEAKAAAESLVEQYGTLRDAAQSFIDTMVMSYSDIEGRDVPSGFTIDSRDAAVSLFDALSAASSPATESGPSLREQLEAAMDCMNYAWTIICNVSEGDWTKQNQEWQDAAARCRDQYHALLDSNPAREPEAGS